MNRLILAALMAGAMTPPAFAAEIPPWGRFSSLGGGIVGGDVEVDIRMTRDGWAMRRTTYPVSKFRQNGRVTWADGRTCPAVEAALAKLPSLPMPTIQVPRPDQIPAVVMDSATYSLEAKAGWDRFTKPIHLESHWGTPLATWVTQTLGNLAECWRPAKPDNVYGVD